VDGGESFCGLEELWGTTYGFLQHSIIPMNHNIPRNDSKVSLPQAQLLSLVLCPLQWQNGNSPSRHLKIKENEFEQQALRHGMESSTAKMSSYQSSNRPYSGSYQILLCFNDVALAVLILSTIPISCGAAVASYTKSVHLSNIGFDIYDVVAKRRSGESMQHSLEGCTLNAARCLAERTLYRCYCN